MAAPAERIPAWAVAALADTSSFGVDAPAVVLLEETAIRMLPDGRVVRHGRRVVRVRAADGGSLALPRVYYVEHQGRAPELAGWRVARDAPDTGVRLEPADLSPATADLHTEVRFRSLVVPAGPAPGECLVAEWEHEDAPPFLDFDLPLQDALPVIRRRVRVEWPASWRVTVRHFPGDSLETPADGGASWSHARLPAAVGAPRRLAFAFRPDRPLRARTFGGWDEVAEWICELAPAEAPAGRVLERARALTAGADSDAEKARRLAVFVQSLRYVSIATGLGRGGGYRPRPARDVLANGYGDCKDKAHLFCALARAAGLRAWLVPVHSSDRDRVQASWPTPQQFDHCIAAVSMREASGASATLEVPGTGRVLFFDPTDPDTPFGELPEPEQGSLALFADARDGRLVRLPDAEPSAQRQSWTMAGQVRPDGSGAGTLRFEARGAAARADRAVRRSAGDAGWADMRVRTAARRAPGLALQEWRTAEVVGDRACRAEAGWSQPGIARTLADGSLALVLPRLADAPGPSFTPAERGADVRLEARESHERFALRVPPGWVAEAPPDTVIASPAVRFERRSRFVSDTLHVERRWSTPRRVVPADSAEAARAGEARLRVAERVGWRLRPASLR